MDAPMPYELTGSDEHDILRRTAHAAGHLPAARRDAAVALALDLYATAARHGYGPASVAAIAETAAAAAAAGRDTGDAEGLGLAGDPVCAAVA